MKHSEATEWLAEYAAGEQPDLIPPSLDLHVRGCRGCKEWLQTHRLLEGVLGSPPHSLALEHPDAELLALCVTRPEEVEELDRADLMAHLALCQSCSMDIEIVRQAVVEARPSAAERASPLSNLRRANKNARDRPLWLLVATACVFAVLASGALLLHWQQGPRGSTEQVLAPQHQATATTAARRVENVQIEGDHIIRGEQMLLVSQVQVRSGAHVRFSAGKAVQFGAGFRINDGGSIAVEVTGGLQ
ncbi:MAG TPA: hypothetical protein VNB06_07850 [Thermoanaerobaculia bacterium]|nr:hypothetical protein [Thermoanaerobaculia bacterium]